MHKICPSILKISQQILTALSQNKPIIALESTIISHGMPYPQNKHCALSIQKTVQKQGAIPATIAIFDGKIHVGLEEKEIDRLAEQGSKVKKVSRRDLASVVAGKITGATTVSATMIAAHAAGIDLFVTGGIGGVHRGFQHTMDVSADLEELGRTPVCVVSAGVKSILDIPRTLQYLQTKGIPVLTYKSKHFPAFFSSSSGLLSPFTVQSQLEAAKILFAQQQLNLQNGTLIAVPNNNPAQGKQIQQAIQKAIKQAQQKKILGAQITPFLLKRVNQLTQGRSLKSNISLVHNNAEVGSRIAVQLAKLKNQARERLKNINISMNINKKQHQTPNINKKSQSKTPLTSTSYPQQTWKPKGRIIAIGGSAIDYQLTPKKGHKFQINKSCIGKTKVTLGGIARNIVDCSSKLGIESVLISALGRDQESRKIRDFCGKYRIKLYAIQPENVQSADNNMQYSSPRYYAILDDKNNEFLGISQMQINDILTFSRVSSGLSNINPTQHDIIILDSNIPQQQLFKIAKHCSQTYKCMIVYQAKGQKASRIITSKAFQYINLIKMNYLQYGEIANAIRKNYAKKIMYEKEIDQWFVKNLGRLTQHTSWKYTGIRTIVTNGSSNIKILQSDPLSLMQHKTQIKPFPPTKFHKTTGAGDTFTSTFCSVLLYGQSVNDALVYAGAASKINIEHDVDQSVITKEIGLQKLGETVRNIMKEGKLQQKYDRHL